MSAWDAELEGLQYTLQVATIQECCATMQSKCKPFMWNMLHYKTHFVYLNPARTPILAYILLELYTCQKDYHA